MYYNKNIINRINKNDNDINFVSENNVNNSHVNKKLLENSYKSNLIPNKLYDNKPYEHDTYNQNAYEHNMYRGNAYVNSSYENNLITKNYNHSYNNKLITSPFGNKPNINKEINKISSAIDNVNNNANFNIANMNDPSQIDINKNNQNINESDQDEEEELPLLEELGINFDLIYKRMKSVFMFYKIDYSLFENSDLSGPLLIVLSLGFILLLVGKSSFSYIYLIGIVSSLSIYILLNMMSQNLTLDLYRTISMLGYALLPLSILSAISIIMNLRSKIGYCISFFCILWSALTASRFFEVALCMNSQRYLIAYPIFLLYSCFALIIMF